MTSMYRARVRQGLFRPVPILVLVAVTMAACGSDASNAPPVVRIDGPTMVSAQPGAAVQLTASGVDPDGGAVALSWDMGDGTATEDITMVEHRYADPGTYLVVLSGQDPDGATATPAEVAVQVGDVDEADTDNFALRFGGTGRDDADRVKILVDDPSGQRTYDADVGATDMTIELWLRARPGENPAGAAACGDADAWIYGNVVLDRDRYSQGRKFGLSIADGRVVFGLTGEDGTAVSLCSATRVDDDRWHHVAVTRSVAGGAIRLFVDGTPEGQELAGPAGDVSYPDRAVPRSECAGAPCTQSDPYLVIGAEKHDAGPDFPSFSGLVDELRLSTAIRYDGAFAPPQQRFEPDASTAALYRFDEGLGPVTLDSAGTADRSFGVVQVGGEQRRPEWVPSDAPTGR